MLVPASAAAGSLALRRVRRQRHAHLGAGALDGLPVELAVELLDPLLDRLERAPPPLGLGVVADADDHAALVRRLDRDVDPRRRAAADRLLDQLADDRVERDLGR